MPVWRSTLPRTENGCGSSGHGSWFSLLAYHQKKAKEQQAGKKQYLWIAELVAAAAATIICGAAVIRTAIPYNGALSWKIDEWRRIIDESSSNANSDINNEENEPAISDEAETETETKTSENIRNSDTWEFNAEDGDMYYFINDITGYRLNVVDAACGSRFYNFEKTKDGGTTWTEVNGDPFDQNMGVAEGLLFFTNDFGFAGLTYASEDFSMLYVTKDGGETFERLELPLDTVTELPSEAAELGFTIEDYDYHTMPQIVDGKWRFICRLMRWNSRGLFFSLRITELPGSMQVVRNDIQKNYEVKIIWNNTAIMRKLEKSHWKRKQYKIVKTQEKAFIS